MGRKINTRAIHWIVDKTGLEDGVLIDLETVQRLQAAFVQSLANQTAVWRLPIDGTSIEVVDLIVSDGDA